MNSMQIQNEIWIRLDVGMAWIWNTALNTYQARASPQGRTKEISPPPQHRSGGNPLRLASIFINIHALLLDRLLMADDVEKSCEPIIDQRLSYLVVVYVVVPAAGGGGGEGG